MKEEKKRSIRGGKRFVEPRNWSELPGSLEMVRQRAKRHRLRQRDVRNKEKGTGIPLRGRMPTPWGVRAKASGDRLRSRKSCAP